MQGGHSCASAPVSVVGGGVCVRLSGWPLAALLQGGAWTGGRLDYRSRPRGPVWVDGRSPRSRRAGGRSQGTTTHSSRPPWAAPTARAQWTPGAGEPAQALRADDLNFQTPLPILTADRRTVHRGGGGGKAGGGGRGGEGGGEEEGRGGGGGGWMSRCLASGGGGVGATKTPSRGAIATLERRRGRPNMRPSTFGPCQCGYGVGVTPAAHAERAPLAEEGEGRRRGGGGGRRRGGEGGEGEGRGRERGDGGGEGGREEKGD